MGETFGKVFCNECYYFYCRNGSGKEFCLFEPDRNYAGSYVCAHPKKRNQNMDCEHFKASRIRIKHVKRRFFKENDVIYKMEDKKAFYDCDCYNWGNLRLA